MSDNPVIGSSGGSGATAANTMRVSMATDTYIDPHAHTTPSNATVTGTGGDLFTMVQGDTAFIQNLGTTTLYVRRATGVTTTAFHLILKASAVQDDGTGGTVFINDHTGVVSVTGTSARYIAWTS